jgi:hypothetical protein
LTLIRKPCGKVRIQHLPQPEISFDDISDSERQQLGGPRAKVGLRDHYSSAGPLIRSRTGDRQYLVAKRPRTVVKSKTN